MIHQMRLSVVVIALGTFPTQGSVNGGCQTVIRVLFGDQTPLPPFNLHVTPFLPQFDLIFTFLTFLALNLTSALSGISNNGVEITVYKPLVITPPTKP